MTIFKTQVPDDAAVADDPGAARAFQLLGGQEAMGQPVRDALDAHDLIVRGMSSQALIYLVDTVPVLSSVDVLSKAIGISARTLQRKRKTPGTQDRLSAEQSSRAWQFAETLARATEVLGDQPSAEAWMMAPAIGLDNRRPIDLLSSSAGAEALSDHLTRMEYGVYS